MPRLPVLAASLLTLALLAAPVVAQEDVPADPTSEASREAAEPPVPQIPLPEIPKLASAELPKPKGEAVRSLETRLAELLSTPIDDPLAELEPRLVTADLDDEIVPAIAQRLSRLKEDLDGDRASRLLEQARKVGKDAIRKHEKANGTKRGEGPDGDWLVFILSLGDSENETWQRLAELYAMLRMLEAVGTTPAIRTMTEAYSYFGELTRIDLQRAVERLKDKAVPALIEAQKHDASKVRRWARLRLEGLGRAIPGEAVSTTDPQILADVLRAFGRVRDVDATRVIMSFASSNRAELRRAAREALGQIGSPAWGHYKDIYKNLTDERPPRDWDYERTLREIFRIHDQSRLAKVYATWEAGKKALEAEKWEEAAEAFDQVLARAPLFEHRAAMAPAYLKRGERLIEEEKWEDAAIALRKAERLRPEGEADKAIDSRLLTLEARSLMEAGTPDRSLLERAVELDPENAQAKALLASFEQDAEERRTTQKSYGAVIGTGAAAVLLLLGVWLPGRRKKAPTKATPPTTGDPSKIASAPPSEEAPPTGKEAPEPEAVAEPPEPPAQGA